MHDGSGIVSDGHWRARAGLEVEVRNRVISEYADRLAAADTWERRRLWQEIEEAIKREVTNRLPREAPPDALY